MINKHSTITLILGALSTFSFTAGAAEPYQDVPSASPTSVEPQTTQPGVPEGLTGPVDTFWKRDTLTGDWGGLREELEDKGITIAPTWQAEVFGNTGGAAQGAISDGLFNLPIDLDLERLTGFWKDATFHANVLYIYGPSLSGQYVGDFSNTSNIAFYNSIRLQELWLQQSFWDKRASVRAGMLAADTEFFGSEASSLFINGTFGAFTLFGANFINAPVYPIASPGVRLDVAPTSKFDFKAAIFGMNSELDPTGNDKNGTRFAVSSSDGPLFALEAAYLVNQSPGDRGLVGTYKVGAFIQHGNYNTWMSQASSALGTGNLSPNETNYAVYFVADQQVYEHGGQTINAFFRGGFAPGRLNFVDRYFDAGLNFGGFVPGRPLDVAGVAIARSGISGDFSTAQQLQGGSAASSETVIEATYKINIAPWWSIQPDVQYIVNPSGNEGSSNAFVLGVRTSIAF